MSIQIKNLTAGYGNYAVIKDLSINIKKGCICTLLGKNGSGKTTLFKCIGGLLKPVKGSIMVDNKDMLKLCRKNIAKLISFVPQKTNSAFSYNVLDMVLMGETSRLKAWEKPKHDAVERAYEACSKVGVFHLVNKNYNQLSGGEQQLVLIARAVMQDTPVMLLDEPTSHLDFYNQHRIMKLLINIVKEKNVTVLITLHDPNLAVNYSNEVVMIEKGIVVAAGGMKSQFNDSNLTKLFGNIIKTDFTHDGLKVAVPIR